LLPPVSPEEAEALHNLVMAEYPEEPSGVRDRGVLESTLLRSVNAALYENADPFDQAATLLWGLVRNHPFVQGNKRTATMIAFFFLERAGYVTIATEQAVLDVVYSIEDGRMDVREVADWFRENIATST